MASRPKLMIPGPIELEGEVLRAMAQPLLPHYGEEWLEVYWETVKALKWVFQTEQDVFLIPGSGSAGLEAGIGSLVGDGSKAIVLSNGFFGERLAAITRAYTSNVQVIEGGLNRPIPPERLEEALRGPHLETKMVAAVHCETSTGVLNPIRDYSELCGEHGAILVVDAISSLGGMELKFDEWNLGICVSASQKGLEASPGLAPLAISRRAWERISQVSTPGWYLNLRSWKKFAERWADWHPYPVTLPVSLVFALKKSLENILHEGLEERFARHAWCAALLRRGLVNLGFELFVPQEHHSPTVTTVLSNSALQAGELIRFLKEERGILIGGGIDELRGKVFRIGHMGPQATLEMILPLLWGIEEALRAAGLPIEPGESLRGLDVSVGAG
ncbi:MAG: pyridoxal-phosphate-dependent aminotransferase family protein [Candidatus Bipolaricaulia bacterium]